MINILLILVMLLTMQCKCTFTKRFTVSTLLHHKENAHVTTIATKIRFVGSNSQAYYDNFHNRLSADFQRRAFFTEVFPWS